VRSPQPPSSLGSGRLTDLDGSALVRVPAGASKRVVVRLGRGNIEATDATREGVVKTGRLRLDLQTATGRVRESAR